MTVHYSDDLVTLHHGDCINVMQELPEASVDAVVTDPPYGIGFMGKAWDAEFMVATTERRRQYEGHPNTGSTGGYRSAASEAGRYDLSIGGLTSFQLWFTEVAAQAHRVLKPGGHLLAFGGTRTWHRLAVAIEDAGFEIRDSIAWMYGSGFPKSLDVSKAIDKAAGAERTESVGPSYTVPNARAVRPGFVSIGGELSDQPASIEYSQTAPVTPEAKQWQGWGTALKPSFEPVVVARKPLIGTVAENVLAYGTGAMNIDGSRVGNDEMVRTAGAGTGVVVGQSDSMVGPHYERVEAGTVTGRWPANVILDESQAAQLDNQADELPSRFFYVPKAPQNERPRDGDTAHPTVKPVDLMRYLVKLVTPPGGVVLEPFAGSGTTLEACVIEHFRVIGIELTDDYLPLIVQRVTKPTQQVMF